MEKLIKREYTGELYDYLCDKLNDKIVFDVGAHVGSLTRKFVDMGAKVIAIEPQTDLRSDFSGVLAVERVCISDRLGQCIFYKCNKSNISTCCSYWKKLHPKVKYKKIILQSVTLDYLVKKYGIPIYIKIDVEGHEDRVLAGLSHKIKFISIEYTRNFEEQFIRCIKEINRLGFSKLIVYKKIKYTNIKDGEFINTNSLLSYFKSLPSESQGDLLIK